MLRKVIKKLYYFTFEPLYQRLKAEILAEIRSELETIKNQGIDQQTRLTRHISEEFIKLYDDLAEIKRDRANQSHSEQHHSDLNSSVKKID